MGSASDPVEDVFAPSASVPGSFTRAGADERALTMPGCEPHSENYGGLLLPPELRTQAGRVELVLQLDARRGRVTPAYLARCNALEQNEDTAVARALPIPRTLLRRSRERLVFRFDGAKFVGPSGR